MMQDFPLLPKIVMQIIMGASIAWFLWLFFRSLFKEKKELTFKEIRMQGGLNNSVTSSLPNRTTRSYCDTRLAKPAVKSRGPRGTTLGQPVQRKIYVSDAIILMNRTRLLLERKGTNKEKLYFHLMSNELKFILYFLSNQLDKADRSLSKVDKNMELKDTELKLYRKLGAFRRGLEGN